MYWRGVSLPLVLSVLFFGCRGDLSSSDDGTDSGTDGSTTTGGSTSATATTSAATTSDSGSTGTSAGSTTGTSGSTGAPVVCGDGNQEVGEECDDGNMVDADGCEANCTLPACENGIVDPGELCWVAEEILSPGAPRDLVVADLDANGRDDLAFIFQGDLMVRMGRPDRTFQSKPDLALGTAAANGTLRFADLNNEGDLDFAISDPDGKAFVLGNGLGDGSFGDVSVNFPSADIFGTQEDLGIGEFLLENFDEGDPYPEVFFFLGDYGRGLPTGNMIPMCPLCGWFQWEASGATVTLPSSPFVGDFNADGRQDQGNYIGSPNAAVFLKEGKGDGTFTNIRSEGFPGMVYPDRLAVGDVNGDGADDFIGMYSSRLWILPGVPAMAAAPAPFEAQTNYNMLDVAIGDVDGDADVDAIACAEDGGFLALINDGGGVFAESLVDGPICDRIRTGDFDGDGLTDLVVRIEGGGVEAFHFRE